MEAWRALRWNGRASGLALLQLSELIQKGRAGDPRATAGVLAHVLGKFPREIVGEYLERLEK